jgi:hypothetical protein
MATQLFCGFLSALVCAMHPSIHIGMLQRLMVHFDEKQPGQLTSFQL